MDYKQKCNECQGEGAVSAEGACGEVPQEADALQCLFLFNIFIHEPEQGTDSTLMKFTDGTHLGDIMNTRDIRKKMIQKDPEKE